MNEGDKIEAESLKKLKDHRDQMRMYSFKQLFNIFRTISNQSEVHDRLCTAEKNIETLFNNVSDLQKEDKRLNDEINKTRKELVDKI